MFIAIPLPKEINATISPLCFGLEHASWMEGGLFYLHVYHLGKLEANTALDLQESLSKIDIPPFTLSLQGIDHEFSEKGKGSIFATVVESPELNNLKKSIRIVLRDLHLKIEKNHHHDISMAIFDNVDPAKLIDFCSFYSGSLQQSFKVERFSLYTLHKTEKREFYEEFATFYLKQ